MGDDNFVALYNELRRVIDEGAEDKVWRFLVDHFREFPPPVQEAIIVGLFQKGLKDMAEAESMVTEVQKAGLAAVHVLQRFKKELEDKKRMLEVKETIAADEKTQA